MMWKKCQLQICNEQTIDELGNKIEGVWQTVADTFCRFTPWTDDKVSLEDREVTKNEQRFAVPISFERFPYCTHVVIDGKRQRITQIIDLTPRYTMIQVEVYKE